MSCDILERFEEAVANGEMAVDEPEPEEPIITNWMKDKKTTDAFIEKIAPNHRPLKVGYLDEPDPKLNYDFVALDKVVEKESKNGETPITAIDGKKVDYPVKIEDEEVLNKLNQPKLAFVPETKYKDAYPLSFLSIKEGEIEKGKEWYLRNDPKLPDDIAELMARYSWGDLKYLTKKQAKNNAKKYKKKGKDVYENNKFQYKKGKFVVSFD